MYAQSDVQRNRQFYVGDGFLYEDFDTYFDQSPLKYITNAKTPTMIHVVEGDPRVPSPQSVELHMALKKLGVPTELFMYPGRSHGIPDARNRLVKSVSEMAWMDYYVRGMGEKFDWEMVLKTLEPYALDLWSREITDWFPAEFKTASISKTQPALKNVNEHVQRRLTIGLSGWSARPSASPAAAQENSTFNL